MSSHVAAYRRTLPSTPERWGVLLISGGSRGCRQSEAYRCGVGRRLPRAVVAAEAAGVAERDGLHARGDLP